MDRVNPVFLYENEKMASKKEKMYMFAMLQKHAKPKKPIRLPKRFGPSLITQDSIFFTLLFAVSAFFALLFFAAGEKVSMDIDKLSSVPAPKSKFEVVVSTMMRGHPMKSMASYIAAQDPLTATFLVAIAKQESNWGKYSPKAADGSECYNYWGYRGQTRDVTPSGYSCFRSPEEAVLVVGGRLSRLIFDYGIDTPRELLVWKCGSSCENHDQDDVARWQRTVGFYSKKIKEDASL